MKIILPVFFTIVFTAFFGFVLGDWYWFEHAMLWPGDAGMFWRAIYAVIFTFGLFGSFAAGACLDD